MDGAVSGLSAAGDQTADEPETNAEGLTERSGGSGPEEKVRAELVPNKVETELSAEESGAVKFGFAPGSPGGY